jgi:hypothetical protein
MLMLIIANALVVFSFMMYVSFLCLELPTIGALSIVPLNGPACTPLDERKVAGASTTQVVVF